MNKQNPDKTIYKKSRNTCPLCGCGLLEQGYSITRYELKYKTDICSGCGFIFMNPAFTDDVISSFYTEEYYSGKADYSYIDERSIKKYSAYVWDRRISVIHRYIKTGSFLDVGSSFGGLLDSAEKYFTPYGIELSEYASTHSALKHGSRIHRGTLDDHPFPGSFFSVITMIELIEHLYDPMKAIRECHRLLTENGLLVIQTANMAGMQAVNAGADYEYYMPGHLSYFTKRSLTLALRNAGFRRIKVFYPVEFGLIPKLLKSRGNFTKISDYRAWFRIARYHMLGKIHWNDFALKSSMVIYAFK